MYVWPCGARAVVDVPPPLRPRLSLHVVCVPPLVVTVGMGYRPAPSQTA
ncbi:hypothetical protein BU14_0692s0003 [Porphyra umbilicalis]|uniref:Uncharacterized protein n=1 Tax=Porphyra umbilicalis TaxID=2786 RepID=A0A1X6NQ68_PORUM|nr:hypothetical protein BU14_0692s0003 [Porphyra umbilicalis]|eukprot:OSX70670.1 hypothetical protein BU14_0692s0003 [Porphyra umbilicalis]